MEKREVIHKFLDLGIEIIQLKSNDKRPSDSWKIPKHLTLDRLDKWEGNYGGVMGDRSNNIVVVDLDQHQLFDYFKDVNTLVVKTPSKGYHLYFKSKKSQDTIHKYLYKPIDIQGNKSYVVIPPSEINGVGYEIVKDCEILEVGDVEKFVNKQLKDIIFDKTIDCREAVKKYLGEPIRDHGKYTQYVCPFHTEKTGSFFVYEDGMHCFGCNWSGNFQMFLQKHQNKTPIQIKEILEGQGYTVDSQVEFRIETKKEAQIRLFSEQIDKDFVIVRDMETQDLFLYVKETNSYIELTSVMLAKLLIEEYGQRVSLKDCKSIMEYFVSNIRYEDKDWISFNNCLVNIETLEVKKPTSNIFTKYHFNYNWSPNSYSERFDNVLKDILIGIDKNEDKYNLFFEMVGYLFTTHNRFNKMFFITGSGGNGKSTLMDLLNTIFKDYKSSSDFHKLSEPFGLEPLLHKLVNILPDLSNKSLSDTSIIKAITGGDAVTVNRKYKTPVDIILPIKFVATGNYLPKTNEDGYAFFRRVVHIQLTNTFKEEVNTEDDNEKELEDVRQWLPNDTQGMEWLIYNSFMAYNNLKTNGWSINKDIDEVQDNYLKLSNPVLWIGKQLFKKDSSYDNFYTRVDVVQMFKKELRKFGLKEPGNNKLYYEVMRDMGADDSTQSVGYGGKERGFIGLVRQDESDLLEY
jgi:P4 family phage/plasmid primase-like protien